MVKYLGERRAFCGLKREQAADEIFDIFTEGTAEGELSLKDLLILLEGNVSTHHIKQQDAK